MAKPGRKPKYGVPMTAEQRKAEQRKWAVRHGWADQINEIVARLPREDVERFLESRILPHRFLEALNEQVALYNGAWFLISGESPITARWQWLAVQCWLWERRDRRKEEQRYEEGGTLLCLNSPARFKPKKSTKHDKPWLNAPFNWAPRRWFGPCPSGPPLQISVAKTVGMRAQLEADYGQEIADAGAILNVEDAHAFDGRKDPNYLRLWVPERGYWGPETAPIKQRVTLIREIDEQPPASVLAQTHEPPSEPVAASPPKLPVGVRLNNYWPDVKKGRPFRCASAAIKIRQGRKRPKRHHDWITATPLRPNNAPYTIDLVFKPLRQRDPGMPQILLK